MPQCWLAAICNRQRPRSDSGELLALRQYVLDFIRRAMPANAPKSLNDEETYQVAAYVLYLNGLFAEDDIMNAQTFPQVRMPNAEGFIDQSYIQ